MADILRDQLDGIPRKNLSIRPSEGETGGKKLSNDELATEQALDFAFARVVARAFELAGWTKERGATELGYKNATTVSKWFNGTAPVRIGRVWACEPLRPSFLTAQAEQTPAVRAQTVFHVDRPARLG